VISDGIFNERFKNKKRWQNKKTLKTLKKRALNKKRKKRLLHLCVGPVVIKGDRRLQEIDVSFGGRRSTDIYTRHQYTSIWARVADNSTVNDIATPWCGRSCPKIEDRDRSYENFCRICCSPAKLASVGINCIGPI